MRFDIITMFPHMFDSYLEYGILGKANTNKKIEIHFWDLKEFTESKSKRVDDTPYGGGPGMILRITPIYNALKAIPKKKKHKIILLSPSGKQFKQTNVHQYIKYDQLIFICGRYEGFDARVKKLVDEEVSIGQFVLAGGELPALTIIEAVSRYVPGVIGHPQALHEESFSTKEDFIEYPQYSKPEIFSPDKKQNWNVPKVLLSGNHKKIQEWKKKKSKKAKSS